jgi:hypothetical protein
MNGKELIETVAFHSKDYQHRKLAALGVPNLIGAHQYVNEQNENFHQYCAAADSIDY